MLIKIFTVYDNKAEAYLPPLFFKTRGEACRAFGDTINDNNTMLGKHPADYQFFELGVYDDATAKFVCGAQQNLGNGVEYLRPVITPGNIKDYENADAISDEPQVQRDTESGNTEVVV